LHGIARIGGCGRGGFILMGVAVPDLNLIKQIKQAARRPVKASIQENAGFPGDGE
jgi:hypothetical protein